MVVKAFQREQDEVNRFGFSNMQVFKQAMRQLRARAITEPILFIDFIWFGGRAFTRFYKRYFIGTTCELFCGNGTNV